MYAAWSAAHRSSCLSRQVGAAIQNGAGDILATGTNDAPKAGGGLYDELSGAEGEASDRRCFAFKDEGQDRPDCRNEREKRSIYSDVFDHLNAAGLLAKDVAIESVRKEIERTRVKDLVEFSRAVHAEMDALLTISRIGGPPVLKASLYTTTYPCHSCARHLVAAGVAEVIFLEAYPKSLASALHGDSIVDVAGDLDPEESDKVRFRVFSGVAPRRYAALFEKHSDLKDRDGRLLVKGPLDSPVHGDKVFTKTFHQFEETISNTINNLAREPR